AQLAILGITPGPLASKELFLAGGPARRTKLTEHRAVHEEIATAFVGDEPALVGVVVDGIANAIAIDMEIVVEEQADLPRSPLRVENGEPSQEQVTVEVN